MEKARVLQHVENSAWWWNDECAKVVEKKKILFEVLEESKNRGEDWEKVEVYKEAYAQAKRNAKNVIGSVKQNESKKWCESMEEKHSKGKVFKAVEQMVKRNRDVTGAGCIRNAKGKVVMEESELREIWRSRDDKLSNEEFDWDRDSLGEKQVHMVSGPIHDISKQEVRLAVARNEM